MKLKVRANLYRNELDSQLVLLQHKEHAQRQENQQIERQMLDFLHKKDQEKALREE